MIRILPNEVILRAYEQCRYIMRLECLKGSVSGVSDCGLRCEQRGPSRSRNRCNRIRFSPARLRAWQSEEQYRDEIGSSNTLTRQRHRKMQKTLYFHMFHYESSEEPPCVASPSLVLLISTFTAHLKSMTVYIIYLLHQNHFAFAIP